MIAPPQLTSQFLNLHQHITLNSSRLAEDVGNFPSRNRSIVSTDIAELLVRSDPRCDRVVIASGFQASWFVIPDSIQRSQRRTQGGWLRRSNQLPGLRLRLPRDQHNPAPNLRY